MTVDGGDHKPPIVEVDDRGKPQHYNQQNPVDDHIKDKKSYW